MPQIRTLTFAACLQALLLTCIHGLNASAQSTPPAPKYIINIVLDDADYSDFGFNNYTIKRPDAVTPNLDKLRTGGRLFPNFFSASSICSPTRVSILTGCNPIRFGALNAWPAAQDTEEGGLGLSGLPSNVPQLGLFMQGLGKRTGHFGKWHVGSSRPEYRPPALGFDEYGEFLPEEPPEFWSGTFNLYSSAWGNYTKYLDNLDEEFTNMVSEFITRNAEDPNGFFVNFWPYSPHAPWTVPLNYDNTQTNFDLTANRGKVLSMMYAIDAQIGRIVALVDSLGIREQTMIILTSDNGGHARVRNRSPRLFGSKGTLFQGGVKVSMIANWPGVIEPNSTNNSVITSYDLMPTLLDLCTGGEPVALYPNIDGRSKRNAFFAPQVIPHAAVYSEVQRLSVRTSDERAQRSYSIFLGNKRLTKVEGLNPFATNAYVLNDLQSDPSGATDIASSAPQLVTSMKRQLAQLRLSTSKVPLLETVDAERITLPFDPRLDVCQRELTFIVNLDSSLQLTRPANILSSQGSFRIEILPDRSVRWTIQGNDVNGEPRQQRLVTAPISKITQLMFTAQGYKAAGSLMHNQIYVNGQIAADSDLLSENEQISSFASTAADLTLGDRRLVLNRIRFHTLRLWPDEI